MATREGKALPFLGGLLAGAAGIVLLEALLPRKGLDPGLIGHSREDPDIPPTVVLPGILGSELVRGDGSEAWLNAGNALGHHDLRLPLQLPLRSSRDGLRPGGLVGVDTVLPRLFGFTEYADLLDLLESAGFRRDGGKPLAGPMHHVFTYDWRRDMVESARALDAALTELAEARGEPDARFNLVGHSMGGLVARYYLRFGTAEPDSPVSWAGARRIRNLVLVATPNAGSIPALDAVLNGDRVGLSSTTLAASVIARMPAIYQLLPPRGTRPLIDDQARPLDVDLHDPATWERFGWGPFGPRFRPQPEPGGGVASAEQERDFVSAALRRAAAFHEALASGVPAPCPVRVVALGGDCLPTLARAVVAGERGERLRFEPLTRRESRAMFEAGDGRVTRASVLGSHMPGAEQADTDAGLPELTQVFFGAADHHGIYSEATFQSILLRLLLRPDRRRKGASREPGVAPAGPAG